MVLISSFLWMAHAKAPEWDGDDPLAVPQIASPAALVDFPGRTWCYPSGLRVDARATPGAGFVAVGSVLAAGSVQDPPGAEGLAHLVEHLVFRAPAGEQEVAQVLEANGILYNAYTSLDRTGYLAFGRAEALEQLLVIEAQRLVDPLGGVDEGRFQVEREVVRNELRQGYEIFGRLAFDQTLQQLFPDGHPYGRSGIGSHESLDGLTLDGARQWARSNYRPEDASLHLRGDLDLSKIPELLSFVLPVALRAGPAGQGARPVPCEAAELPSEEPPQPTRAPGGFTRVEVPVERPFVRVAWSFPGGAFGPEGATMASAASMLEFSIADRTRLNASCYVVDIGTMGLLACDALVPFGKTPRTAVNALERAAGSLWEGGGWSWGGTYKNIRNIVVTQFLTTVEGLGEPGHEIHWDDVAYSHRTGKVDYVPNQYGLLATPAIGNAVELRERWLSAERAVFMIIEPPRLDVENRPGLDRPAPLEMASWDDEGPLDLQELALDPSAARWADLERFTLDNGLEVVLFPHSGTSRVRLLLVAPGGRLAEPTAGVHAVAGASLRSLNGEIHGLTLSRVPWKLGGGWLTSTRSDGLALGVVGSRANLDAMTYLLRKRLEQASVGKADRRQYLREKRRSVKEVERDAPSLARRLRMDHLLGDHPSRVDPTRAQARLLSQVSPKEAKAWLDTQLQPGAATLVVSGSFDPDAVRRSTRRWLGPWDPDPQPLDPARAVSLPPASRARTVLVAGAEGSQYRLDMGCQLQHQPGAATPVQELAAAWMDETLSRELRHRRGLTYGASAWLRDVPGGGVLLEAQARVEREGLAEALRVLRSSLDALSAGPTPSELAALARSLAARGSLIAGSPSGGSDAVVEEVLTPGTIARRARWASEVVGVVPEDFAQALQGCNGKEILTIQGEVGYAREELIRSGWEDLEVVGVRGADR